ncbi:MAG: sialate O-acetylesterase [Cyclobacteriaceae bacterium]|nr:sialate O-acetylesterase [Cyclobacteriaceae bacterium]
MDGAKYLWSDPDTNYTAWKEMDIPQLWESAGLAGLDGVVWFAHEFQLDPQDVLNDLEIHLGQIDDNDIAWINGFKIGETQGYNLHRAYHVAKDQLKTGRNIVVVRVEDTGGGGGIYGEAADMYVKLSEKKIALSGSWRFRIGKGDFSSTVGPNSMPSLLYNAMIHPLIPYGIKGAIWYQGESNTSRAYQYRTTFPLLINNWREDWGLGAFPFFFVQLANFMAPSVQPEQSAWAELREAQSLTLSLPNTGMATAIDIGEANDIHPRNKQEVGRRLALNAIRVAYHQDVVASGPSYNAMQIEGNRAMISFDHIGSGLYLKDKYGYVNGFAIAGRDKVFRWARAQIMGDQVMVWSDMVAEPVAVRYAWGNNPDDVNLYNLEGLPAVPFRTDNWPGITVNERYR